MKLSNVISKYNDLSHGKYHPTHLWVGQEVWDALRGLPDVEWSNGAIRFYDAVVYLRNGISPCAVHFENSEYPHDPRYNAYVDFASSPNAGLNIAPQPKPTEEPWKFEAGRTRARMIAHELGKE